MITVKKQKSSQVKNMANAAEAVDWEQAKKALSVML